MPVKVALIKIMLIAFGFFIIVFDARGRE